MPKVRYLKPTPEDQAWAAHVRQTSAEVLDSMPGVDYVAVILGHDGNVVVEASGIQRQQPAEWFVGRPGQIDSDDELHELAVEAIQEGGE